MKYYLMTIALGLMIGSCSSSRTLEEIKADYGTFENGETIKLIPADYRNTPVGHKVEHHPESYEYLKEVEIFSMAHISDDLFVTGYVVQPKKPGKYPCVVYNRGGNGDLGQLLMATAVEQMATIAAQGYVVVATNYRGTSYSEGADEFGGADVHDVINLIGSLPELDKADTSLIGLFGVSRGGMMNYLVCKELNDKIDAVITMGGISDLEMTIEYHPEIGAVCEERIANFKENKQQIFRDRSAIEWTDSLSEKTAFLILHGTNDQHVKFDQAQELANAMKSNELHVKFEAFEGGSHGLTEDRMRVIKLCAHWFDTHLRN